MSDRFLDLKGIDIQNKAYEIDIECLQYKGNKAKDTQKLTASANWLSLLEFHLAKSVG